MSELPDIQCSIPNISIPIRQVGVENIIVPFNIELKKGGFHNLTAKVSIRTNLNENIKGISILNLNFYYRFLKILLNQIIVFLYIISVDLKGNYFQIIILNFFKVSQFNMQVIVHVRLNYVII